MVICLFLEEREDATRLVATLSRSTVVLSVLCAALFLVLSLLYTAVRGDCMGRILSQKPTCKIPHAQ